MTEMFCDMKGFSSLSEGMTPQGLVKVMNRYLSTMSEPIRTQQGIIDKYIGDAIMAYWGAPFIEEADQAKFACLAAIEMMDNLAIQAAEAAVHANYPNCGALLLVELDGPFAEVESLMKHVDALGEAVRMHADAQPAARRERIVVDFVQRQCAEIIDLGVALGCAAFCMCIVLGMYLLLERL